MPMVSDSDGGSGWKMLEVLDAIDVVTVLMLKLREVEHSLLKLREKIEALLGFCGTL